MIYERWENEIAMYLKMKNKLIFIAQVLCASAFSASAFASPTQKASPVLTPEAFWTQLILAILALFIAIFYVFKHYNDILENLKKESELNKVRRSAVEDAIIVANYDGEILDVNHKAIELFEYTRQELLKMNIRLLIPNPNLVKSDDTLLNQILSDSPKELGTSHEYFARTAKGKDIPILLTVKRSTFDGKKIFSANMRDIRKQVVDNQEIHDLAFRDKLTNLPNLTAFYNYIEKALVAIEKDERLVFALVEIEQFGDLNNTFGFSVGDQILNTVSKRLQNYYASADFVARVGSDTFAMIWSTNNQMIDARYIVKGLVDYASVPIVVESIQLQLTFNAGVLVAPDHTVDPLYVMPFLSQALKKARTTKGGNIEVFNRALTKSAKNSTMMIQELKEALINDNLIIHVQPKVDMNTRLIIGTESLLRWKRADKTFISPAEFIPLAEKSDLIFDISRLVVRKTLEFNRDWHDRGLPPIMTSLNISPPQLISEFFVEHMIEDITAAGIDPKTFECEITETATMENRDQACTALQRLREYGITITIDDFGTGHASLQYISELPVDILKIDKSFISNFHFDLRRRSMVSMIAKLGETLGLNVIAEGVEHKNDEKALLELGINHGQGFFYSKAMSVDEMLSKDWTKPVEEVLRKLDE